MYWTLIKAGILRKKARSILTVLSVSVAFLLFGLLQAASPIFTGQMEGLRADLVMTMSRYNMMGKLPYSHVEFIEEIEGVEAVLYMDYITSISQDSMFDGITVAMGGDIEIYDRFKITEEPYNEDPPYCRTALWEATWRNHEAIVKDLINQGAQVDLPDAEGTSPLHEAAYFGYLPLVELLLDNKADINRQDKKGQTPLFRAVQGTSTKDRNVDVVQFLISAGAECNVTDSDGCTIQHLACFNGDPEMSWWLFYQRAWKNRFTREDWPNGLPPGSAEEVDAEE
jgi:hypothetical protein